MRPPRRTIRGTRVTVKQIVRELGEGATIEQVVETHPRLTADDGRAATLFSVD